MKRTLATIAIALVGCGTATEVSSTVVEPDIVTAARQAFDVAGLDFPVVEIDLSGDCDHHYNGTYGHGNVVEVCNGEVGTLLHELGHAWESQNMTDSARQAFADRLGLDTWANGDLPWNERANERVAEVIKWKVSGGSPNGIYQEYFDIITETP